MNLRRFALNLPLASGFSRTARTMRAVSRGVVLKNTMIKQLIFILILFSTSVLANDNTGRLFFGKNLAKPLDEHTDRIYLKIDDSEKLYFNRKHEGPILENLDCNQDHIVKVYYNDKIAQSWILNFSKLKTHNVIIWRSSGSWRMETLEDSKD